ncbi:anthranilate synthase component I family protein [Nocardioides caldifontis]|uniref:anthranilate synthase component I family protein n=1 Tax=Nocardioides caldifontis TaxID=2588938 RepID=UPI00193AD777|nr:anthranilate synthase component I family protein [Nocardioides caldifontis]
MNALADAAGAPRVFWLPGTSARTGAPPTPWSGGSSLLGVLADDDVSLTFDAGRGEVLRHQGGTAVPVGHDVFAVLEEELARDAGDPEVWWVGYVGYGCRTDLPGRPADPASGVPDAVWMRLRSPQVVSSRPSWRETAPRGAAQRPNARHEGRLNTKVTEEYAEAFVEVQRQLRRGNSYEVNLTYREQLRTSTDPVTAYLRLSELNPAPYAGYLRHPTAAGSVHLVGSSPERYARIDADRVLEARPIKGTTPRGATAAEDARERERLGSDRKFLAENLMIVDLLRNDLSMVCEPGTVAVPSLMTVESYASVHQLVSTVRGRLRDDVSTVEALRALFPAGSMTGAPKRRTMEIIDAVESTPRGVYSGAFGWITADGRADLGVIIRTLVATPDGGEWRYEWGTGGGITVRSDLDEEWAETQWKAARLRAALQG